MRRITLGLLLTATALVLMFSYHTSTQGVTTLRSAAGAASLVGGATTTTVANGSPGAEAGPGGSGAGPGGVPTTTPKSSKTATLVIDGATVDTRRGPVQVRVTFTGSKITQIEAPVVPNSNPRDWRINQYALPILHDEVIAAQSATIDSISGATVTTDGYVASLQSAIDLFHQQK